MSFLITVFWKKSTVNVKFSPRNPQCNKVNMDFFIFYYEQSLTPQNFHISLIMSMILAETEKSRLINVFQAFAMNVHESLLTCLQKSDGLYEFVLWWCGRKLTYNQIDLSRGLGKIMPTLNTKSPFLELTLAKCRVGLTLQEHATIWSQPYLIL